MPNWSRVEIAWSSRYLGFHIGPARSHNSWVKASTDFQKRVLAWSGLNLGMCLNACMYRTFCCSVFSFLWQLEDPPTFVLELEAWAVRRMAPGPGNWIRPCDLHHLRSFGHPYSFPSISHTSLAAKIRVATYEPQLQLKYLHTELLQIFADNKNTQNSWNKWYDSSYVLSLSYAVAHAERLGVTSIHHGLLFQVQWLD